MNHLRVMERAYKYSKYSMSLIECMILRETTYNKTNFTTG